MKLQKVEVVQEASQEVVLKQRKMNYLNHKINKHQLRQILSSKLKKMILLLKNYQINQRVKIMNMKKFN